MADLDNTVETTVPNSEEYEALLPDGWGEGDDIFNPNSWGGNAGQTDASITGAEPTIEELLGMSSDESDPTTESDADAGVETDEATEESPTTETTEDKSKSGILKFKARVDHEDRDVELDEADLPGLYQKAQVTDRVQTRLNELSHTMDKANKLAKLMGYKSADEMLDEVQTNYRQSDIDKLISEGVQKDVAEEVIESRYARMAKAAETTEGTAASPAKEDINAQLKADVSGFYDAHPDLRAVKVPDEVYQATLKGTRFNVAYQAYLDKQTKTESEKLRKENQILKQNAASAARAPVRGVKGGGATNVKGQSEFERLFDEGFNSEEW